MAEASGMAGGTQALYTVDDLRERWQVGRALIDREVARGRLRRIKIGGATRFSAEEVSRYERERTSGGAEGREAERCTAN